MRTTDDEEGEGVAEVRQRKVRQIEREVQGSA